MPSSPRKRAAKSRTRAKPQEVRDDDDSDTASSMPSLVDSDSDDEGKEKPRKAVSNAESVEMWLDLSKASRERHIRVMKIYLLSPFLFDIVEQDDKWINWAHECNLLPTKKNIDPSLHIQECMEAVGVVEDAFNNVTKYLLAKEDSDETEKVLEMMDKINTQDKLDKAIEIAESFSVFSKIRDHIKTAQFKKKGDGKRKGDVSLLLALQQMYDHIRKLTRENNDLTKQFEETCRQSELQSTDMKKKGNTHFMDGKYKAAISAYSKAILMSQYSYILYGNRAQSYLRTKETWLALFDGRRAVVLKPEWTKGQYRYAQAYFELGQIDQAITTNREAKEVCSKDSRDLDLQYERFLKEKDIQRARKNANADQNKHQPKMKDINDVPDLVEPDSCDTSEGSSDEDEDDFDNEDDDFVAYSSDDNNSDTESIPELVTDSSRESDSDDDVPQKKNQKTQIWNSAAVKPQVNRINAPDKLEMKKRKRKEKDKNKPEPSKRKELDTTEGPQKRKDLTFILKQGSKAYLDGKVKASVRYYGEAFEMLSPDNAFEIYKIKSIDYILILYAHGTACLETGIYKELLEATKQFETIIVKYKDIKFPLAFYGLGRVYRRHNKFSEALVPLNQGFNMVKCGEEFGQYRWPGTQTIIEETKPGKLKVAFENIMSLCQHPPRPDAICRYNECNIGRINIYLTDPDYKGFVRLICDESCKIDYHPICWKKYKSTYGDKNADKDYLEDVCLTPDCGSSVARIQIYGTEGLKTEFVSENIKVKQKQAKQNKVKAHGNQKQPKVEKPRKEKEEVKVDNAKKDIAEPENKDATPTNDKNAAPANDKNKTKPVKSFLSDVLIAIEAPEEKEIDKAQAFDPKQVTKDSRGVDTGVYILRKGEERMQDEVGYMRGGKGKGKKKKAKNVQSLDEFLKDHGGESTVKPGFPTVREEDEEKPENSTLTPSQWVRVEPDTPFAVPPHLQSDVLAFERDYQATMDQHLSLTPKKEPSLQSSLTPHKDLLPPKEKSDVDLIEDYVYSLFKEMLNAHGPLDVADARMIEPINFLPESHQKKIQECGGLKEFLMKSDQFVVHGNVVMLPDELHFQEIVKTVNKYINDNKPSMKTLNTSAMEYESHVTGSLDPLLGNGIAQSSNTSLRKLPLNPEVKDFLPSSSSFESFLEDELLNKELSKENLTITSTEDIDAMDGEESLKLSHEEVGTEQRKQSLLELLSNMGQSKSPWELKKKDMFEDSKVLSSNGSKMMSKLDVFHVSYEDSITPTVAAKTSPRASSHENSNLQQGGRGESLSSLGDGSQDNLSEMNGQLENSDFKITNGHQMGSMSTLSTPTKHKRAESSGSENTIGYKTKGVQTQFQVKAKGVMTDAQPEPYKVECLKVSQERDDIQRKYQDTTEKLNNIQEKHNQELEKIKKKYTDVQTDREKLQKELQSSKQEGESELKKLGETCEEKVKLANSLEQHFKVERQSYQTTINGLQNELTAAKNELANEKTKFNSSLAQKEELIKKANALKQQQETRAQDAEVKLLELRRDVGLRFLERALQEAHVTVTNLMEAKKTSRNPGTITKLDELLAVWKSYANDCHQKIIQCKASFNLQIQELKGGRLLSSLPQLPIPGPAQFPAPPILQPLNFPPQAQPLLQQQNHPKPNLDVLTNPVLSLAAPQMAVVAPQPHPMTAGAAMPQPGIQRLQQQQHQQQQQQQQQQQLKGHPGISQIQQPHQVPQQIPQGVPEGTSLSGAKPDADSKSRPSNSFEKIMLRLSTMYPYLARADLTGLIKEVRQNKRGTLTGMSLEKIVECVCDLVDAKIKVGIIRLPAGQQETQSPRSTPKQARPFQNTLNPPGLGMNGTTKNSSPPPVATAADNNKPCSHFELDEDDPCVICHDDMKSPIDTVTLECGHKYHNACIRKWLLGEQSTCPTCRVHALLPDEFPRLK